jgi:hypothetical protein
MILLPKTNEMRILVRKAMAARKEIKLNNPAPGIL